IWLGTFKLRVNLPRFARGDTRKEMVEIVPESSKAGEARKRVDQSFKDALVREICQCKVSVGAEKKNEADQGAKEVVWEVEAEVIAKLKGAYVGFLAEPKEL
ncbi:hypothetical protein A2U01_0071043, partial [Trifolium medium]|nr:hypothetical protein [Trifolium medium]